MKIIKIVICILTALVISGCVFSEGDDKAEKSFSLMTTQEKAMHDKAKDGFSEKYVMAVRRAVYNREVKPDENMMPFMDIANVIKFVNENILIAPDSWTKSNREKSQRSKFSSQDVNWYRKIIKLATNDVVVESNEADQDIAEKHGLSVKEVENIKEGVYERVLDRNIKRVNKSDLLPLEDYRDLYHFVRGCESAINIIQSAASKNKPLTIKDRENIVYQKSVCETKKLNENL